METSLYKNDSKNNHYEIENDRDNVCVLNVVEDDAVCILNLAASGVMESVEKAEIKNGNAISECYRRSNETYEAEGNGEYIKDVTRTKSGGNTYTSIDEWIEY